MDRLRWRFRGATMWPAFAVLLVIEAALFEALPFSGDGPDGLVGALLLAAGLNLVVIAALAPLGGMLWRRRRPDLPQSIAADQAGTVLLVVLLVALTVAGLVNRSAVVRDERALAAAVVATSRYVHAQAPAYADFLESTDAIRIDVGIYRTCTPGRDPERPLCLIVNTNQQPADVVRDPDLTPNYRG